MQESCPIINEVIRQALECEEYYEILMGKGRYWIEEEKFCERNSRLWHARASVVDGILDWAVWKDDIQGVMAKFSETLERIAEDDPLVLLDTLHAYEWHTKQYGKFRYGPQEEEVDIDFGLDCWRFYDLAKSKESNLEQYHYNEDELRVYHRLLEVLPQYFPERD